MNTDNSKNPILSKNVSSSNGLEPLLRFPEFNTKWGKTTLDQLCSFFSGGTPTSTNKEFYNGDIPFIRSGEIHSDSTELYITKKGLENSSAKMVHKGDLLYALYGATSGEVDVSKIDGAINQAILCIRPLTTDNVFLKNLLEKDKTTITKTYLQGGQGNLSAEIIKNLKVFVPLLPEQKKIVEFLSLVDERIEQQRQLVEALKRYKRGVVYSVFNPKNTNNKQFYMGDLLTELNNRDSSGLRVCSVAVSKGVVDQLEHLGRCFAASDTSNYRRVRYGDVVYTKSPTGDFPFGIVKQSKIKEDVAVSPLYGIYEPRSFATGNLLHLYFEQSVFANNYIRSLAQKGAKNTINITTQHFLEKEIVFPADEKDRAYISNLFDALNESIQQNESFLDKLRDYKGGLLQQMFI